MKRKIIPFITAVIFMICTVPAPDVSAVTFKPGFTLNSKAAVMVNLDTGETILNKMRQRKCTPLPLLK